MTTIATWNMEGASYGTADKWNRCVAKLAARNRAVCLQEAGAKPESARRIDTVTMSPTGELFWDPDRQETTEVGVYAWGGTASRDRYLIFHHDWDQGRGRRVNTAVVIGKPFPTEYVVLLLWGEDPPHHRAALGVFLPEMKWVFSFHAISGSGADVHKVLTTIPLQVANRPWAIGADFNREPDSLRFVAYAVDAVICPPGGPTRKVPLPTRRLDYMVACAGTPARQGRVVYDEPFSDHYPVEYNFS